MRYIRILFIMDFRYTENADESKMKRAHTNTEFYPTIGKLYLTLNQVCLSVMVSVRQWKVFWKKKKKELNSPNVLWQKEWRLLNLFETS